MDTALLLWQKELERIGAEWFAVSNLEAIQLRRSGIEGNMLILGYTPPQEAARLHEMNISQTVFSYEYGKELAEHAVAAGVQVKIHIKVDTGMSRIGFFISGSGTRCGCQMIDFNEIVPTAVYVILTCSWIWFCILYGLFSNCMRRPLNFYLQFHD